MDLNAKMGNNLGKTETQSTRLSKCWAAFFLKNILSLSMENNTKFEHSPTVIKKNS
jgi:hypothetical protein